MKTTNFAASILLLATSAIAAPVDYTPPGGVCYSTRPVTNNANIMQWESVKYPPGTGENLPYYPPPPGGWESVNYPAGTGSGSTGNTDGPFVFTSTYHVTAVGSEVRNGTTPAPGPTDAVGFFRYGINAPLNTICYVSLITSSSSSSQPLILFLEHHSSQCRRRLYEPCSHSYTHSPRRKGCFRTSTYCLPKSRR